MRLWHWRNKVGNSHAAVGIILKLFMLNFTLEIISYRYVDNTTSKLRRFYYAHVAITFYCRKFKGTKTG